MAVLGPLDAGMPTAVASVDAGASTATASITVTVKPVRPRRSIPPQALPDAGPTCPECPEVVVTAQASGSGAPCSATATAESPPPLVLKETDAPTAGKRFGVGAGGGWAVSRGTVGVLAEWQPFAWLEVTAYAGTGPVVLGGASIRFP